MNILKGSLRNNLKSIKDNTVYSSNYFLYVLVLIYNKCLLITSKSLFTPSLTSLRNTQSKIFIVKKDYFNVILKYIKVYDIIIIYRINLDNFEIEFLREYSKIYDKTIILISKNINIYDYELKTNRNIFLLDNLKFKIIDFKIVNIESHNEI